MIYKLLVGRSYPADQLDAFIGELRSVRVQSLDSFLEKRQHEQNTVRVGRAVIAALMGQPISESKNAARSDDDWWPHVFERMHQGAATGAAFLAGNSNVRFVTFNFDALIEEHLCRDVQPMFRSNDFDLRQ